MVKYIKNSILMQKKKNEKVIKVVDVSYVHIVHLHFKSYAYIVQQKAPGTPLVQSNSNNENIQRTAPTIDSKRSSVNCVHYPTHRSITLSKNYSIFITNWQYWQQTAFHRQSVHLLHFPEIIQTLPALSILEPKLHCIIRWPQSVITTTFDHNGFLCVVGAP